MNKKHGASTRSVRTPEHVAWVNMRARILNPRHPKFADYGGRGITICPAWDDFTAFLADVGPRPSRDHSLDRIDNDGNYEPGNVRWATRGQQQHNTRRTKLSAEAVAEIRAGGDTVSGFARRFGVDRKTIRHARDGVGWQ